MSKTFRPYDPDQIFLMPASLQDWLPKGHLAYFVSDVVDHLDLSAIMEHYAKEERGYPPYLLHWCPLVSEDRKTFGGGHRLPGAGREQHP